MAVVNVYLHDVTMVKLRVMMCWMSRMKLLKRKSQHCYRRVFSVV